MKPTGPIPVEPEYPGIEFFPPDGLLDPEHHDGELLVKWKKVGDRYTFVEADGEPLTPYKRKLTKAEIEDKKETMRAMTAFEEIDMIANLGVE